MYLKFNREESQLLFQLSQAATPQKRADILLGHLWSLEKNQKAVERLSQEGKTREIVVAEIAGRIDPTAPLEKSAMDMLVAIHGYGLLVPLPFDLLFKNLNALSQMAREVGLGSFQGAMEYQFAGLEEIQSVFNQLLKNTSIQRTLLEKGWISLQSGQVGAFGYQAAGGFIIVDSAKLTDASHAVIADEDLGNELAEKALAWIRAGKGAPDVVKNARLMNTRRGDLLIFEEEPGLTADQVRQLLVENGIEGAEAARAVMGDRLQVKALPIFAFQLFASEDGLPPVVVLSVAVRLQDEQGNTYTLVLMA